MKLRQQSAISRQHAAKTRLVPAFWEERREADFMQDMFRPAQLSSKETVTEAEIVFCPAAMVGAATFSRE